MLFRSMVKSIPGQLSMFAETICGDSRNVISSQGSAAGRTHSASQGGPMTGAVGADHVHVSRFRARDCRKAISTNDTSGPLFTASSKSASLQSYLESRLRAALGGNGFPQCVLTWKHQDMPSGPPSFRLAVWAPPIDVTGNGLLPTPSGTSNHGKNHVAGRLDEWGGSSNDLRGTPIGKVHSPAFELWMMGFPAAWRQQMPPATRLSRRSRQNLSGQ